MKRKRLKEEIERDFREHIERETEEHIERGMSPEEARYGAPQVRQHRAAEGRHPRRVDLALGRRAVARPALRSSNAQKEPGFRRCCGFISCSRHRPEHRDIQPD